MTSPDALPIPSGDPGDGGTLSTDTGKPVPVGDVRAEFAQISSQVPPDSEAERSFIAGKIAMIQTDPQLSEEQKRQAIGELGLVAPS